MPGDHKLELFVTATDFFGYGRQVPYADPNPIHDTRHRHVLTFRYGGEDRQRRLRLEVERRTHVRGPDDLVHPGRVPACEL